MLIGAGHTTVEHRQREPDLAGCVSIVEQARETVGCLDFATSADLIGPGRAATGAIGTGRTGRTTTTPTSKEPRP